MSSLASKSADLVSIAVRIVGAYVAHNVVPATALPSLIESVHASLASLGAGKAKAFPHAFDTPLADAIRESVTPDALVSFIDGRRYKILKRHLKAHGLDPVSYRQRFGLPPDYPMVAPNYAQRRSELARSIAVGQSSAMGERIAA